MRFVGMMLSAEWPHSVPKSEVKGCSIKVTKMYYM